MRLQVLVRQNFLRAGLVDPPQGGRSRYWYGLTSKSLSLLDRSSERYLLVRPQQHILEYLLLRNDVYARARAEGWHIGSPIFTPPADHGRYLELFHRWATEQQQRELARTDVSPAERLRAHQDFERLPLFLPKALTFEFLVKVGPDRAPAEVALVVIDDPRRSIERQIDGLPAFSPPRMRLVLRDTSSRYDPERQQLTQPSARLRKWRRLLTGRLGEEVTTKAELFPELWARKG